MPNMAIDNISGRVNVPTPVPERMGVYGGGALGLHTPLFVWRLVGLWPSLEPT